MTRLKYGFNIGTSDMKALLEQEDKQLSGIRSWKQLFSGASQQYAAQNSALVSSYSDTIAEAYKANMAQSDAIASAGLNLGATRELIESNRAALHNAYQTYIQNYGKAVNENAADYADTQKAYDDELTARAENFSKLYNYAYQYLAEELAGSTKGETSWLTANNLDWLYDTELNAAKPWEQLSKQLFDQSGVLTREGQEFFDAMFNAQTGGYLTSKGNAARGFDQWLSDTDADLRDWYIQGDVYNYTRAGTNFGTAKSLLGLESTDQSHSEAEYVYESDTPVLDVTFVETTGQELTPLYNELLELDSAYQAVKTQREQLKTEAMKPGAGNTNSAYEYARLQADENLAKSTFNNASEEYLKKQKDALGKITEGLNTSLKKFETSIGEEAYKTFMARNKTTYDKLQKLLSYERYLSPENIAEIKSLLDTLNKEFAAETKKLSEPKKSSGL